MIVEFMGLSSVPEGLASYGSGGAVGRGLSAGQFKKRVDKTGVERRQRSFCAVHTERRLNGAAVLVFEVRCGHSVHPCRLRGLLAQRVVPSGCVDANNQAEQSWLKSM